MASAMPASSMQAGNPYVNLKRDYNSENWCGMVKTVRVDTVEASWMNPSATATWPGNEYEAYQWVGIDGSTRNCQTILQAGTGQYIYTNGTEVTFWWYEFYPAPPVLLYDGINIGDTVHVKVKATSGTEGVIYLDNSSTGYSKQIPITSYQGSLCFQTAEWIQEAPLKGGKLPQFPSFDMTNCAASANGQATDASGSEPWYMTYNGQTVCHAQLRGGSDVGFFYG
ncbi:hypothetical protein PWT90_10198 [Aphanocladium album]|nr:hypothetical protein PWT90_10198 [Aphanocladium album]